MVGAGTLIMPLAGRCPSALDEQGLLETRQWFGLDAIAIATTDFDDPIYLCPGSSEADTVYITTLCTNWLRREMIWHPPERLPRLNHREG
jgi:hypothetical protein